MESIIDDIKKVLGEKFNGLDTRDENFQEKAQAIVDEIIEVNKEKIGNFVPHKTRDEELAREMAKAILANNQAVLGKKDTEKAIEKIDEEGGEKDVKKKKTTRVRNTK